MTTHSTHWRRSGLILAIALGSGSGALARYAAGLLGQAWYTGLWPWPTLLINALGSALIGYCAALTLPQARWAHQPLRSHALMVGFCGGFTTCSLFSLEVWLLFQRHPAWAVAYAAASWLVWLAAVALGFRAGQPQGR